MTSRWLPAGLDEDSKEYLCDLLDEADDPDRDVLVELLESFGLDGVEGIADRLLLKDPTLSEDSRAEGPDELPALLATSVVGDAEIGDRDGDDSVQHLWNLGGKGKVRSPLIPPTHRATKTFIRQHLLGRDDLPLPPISSRRAKMPAWQTRSSKR